MPRRVSIRTIDLNETEAPIDVFLSYQRGDREVAKALAEVLARRGYSVWWDVDLLPGDRFADEIAAIIEGASATIVLWSIQSVASDFVRAEAEMARQAGKLVPARLDGCRVPLPFNILHIHDMTQWRAGADEGLLQSLLDSLSARVGQLSPEAAAQPAIADHLHGQDHEVLYWRSITENRVASDEEYRAYLNRFGANGLFADLAALRIAASAEPRPNGSAPPHSTTSRRDLAAGSVFRDVDAPWCPEMVVIPAGRFLIGSPAEEEGRFDNEGPRHFVTIAEPLALGRYPVTFDEYDEFAARTGRAPTGDEGWGRGRRPVINVSWEDAQAYAAWLGELTGGAYRLPSEAEWEYACRAGTTAPFHFGSMISTDQANYDGAKTYGAGRKGVYREQTVPVGSFPANAFGLHDMHGNAWEWCDDAWHENYEDAPVDGSAWLKSGDQGRRILRGGSWSRNPCFLRSAYRGRERSSFRNTGIGFRVARTLSD